VLAIESHTLLTQNPRLIVCDLGHRTNKNVADSNLAL